MYLCIFILYIKYIFMSSLGKLISSSAIVITWTLGSGCAVVSKDATGKCEIILIWAGVARTEDCSARAMGFVAPSESDVFQELLQKILDLKDPPEEVIPMDYLNNT